ncbi:hypothetical protein GCM10010112_21950 [Actinoplanes lobatus]|uniref:Excreted virulence factor EspC (Type VII ESX diderm) n=1 Tax=Actinoplanes lobatus TaxID=113568 RepID=A0A7W7HPT8_9ACTN|nr:hypothetical protein [Actinoplanes lobatus]MBB4754449.1 hypothetical protein [Actinoplanes lobatus]GGN63071.1 hypothetical protein GCM10010112_21950 [Actinoplanes lobatus]GIE40471.1 hypothetical protein Alo02nite_33690 [Actinoplanes lobatus]
MTDRLDIDTTLLDAIADRLDRAGQDVDATGAAAPAPPDAGLATPLVADVLALLCGNAAKLAGDLRAIGSRITEANRLYTEEDAAAGSFIRRAS